MAKLLACLLLCGWWVAPATAQRLEARLSREQVLLGERTELSIRLLDVPATASSGLRQWFQWPRNGGPIELLFASRMDTLEEQGRRSFLQTLTLTGFDSGRHALPALEAVVWANGVEKRFALPPLTLEVLPVNIEGMEDFHPPKPLLNLRPPQQPWWQAYRWWLVAAGLALALGLLWLGRRRKPPPVQVPAAAGLHYQELLARLQAEQPEDQAAWRQWAHRLDAALRLALSQLVSPELQVADHGRWPQLLQTRLHPAPAAEAALGTYIVAMDPVQFGDRWPAFDQSIIQQVVLPLLAPLQTPPSSSTPSTAS